MQRYINCKLKIDIILILKSQVVSTEAQSTTVNDQNTQGERGDNDLE